MKQEEQPFPLNDDEPEPGARTSTENSRPRSPVIGTRIRAARLAIRLKQRELAGQQFSTSYISALERGKVIPSFQALRKLAARLGVTMSALLGESELDLNTLAAGRRPDEFIAEIERTEFNEAIRMVLGKAEGLLVQGQAFEALHLLGDGNRLPSHVTDFERMQWSWLSSWAWGFVGNAAQALLLAKQGFVLAEQLLGKAKISQKASYTEWVERLRCYLGIAYCANGHPGLAWLHHRQCFSALGEGNISDPYLKLVILKGLGKDALGLGWYRDAISFYRAAKQQAENLNVLREQGLIAWGLGVAYQHCSDFSHAKCSYQEALEAFGTLENLQMVAQVRILLGNLHVELQEFPEAEKHLRRSLASAENLNDLRTRANTLNHLSALCRAKQEIGRAIELAQEGLALAGQGNNQWTESDLYLTLAEAYQMAQEYKASEQAFQVAIQIAKQGQNYNVLNNAYDRYSKFLYARGQFEEAYKQFERTFPLESRSG